MLSLLSIVPIIIIIISSTLFLFLSSRFFFILVVVVLAVTTTRFFFSRRVFFSFSEFFFLLLSIWTLFPISKYIARLTGCSNDERTFRVIVRKERTRGKRKLPPRSFSSSDTKARSFWCSLSLWLFYYRHRAYFPFLILSSSSSSLFFFEPDVNRHVHSLINKSNK